MNLFAAAKSLASDIGKLVRPSGATAPLNLSLQYLPVSGSLTPSDVSSHIRMADSGYPYGLCDLANKFRQQDGHMQAILGTREAVIAKLQWQIIPQDPSRRRSLKVAKFVEDSLRGMGNDTSAVNGLGVRDFRYMIAHIASAFFYGYSVSEVLWEKKITASRKPGKPTRVKMVPLGVIPIGHRRFIFDMNTGRLCQWDNNSIRESNPYPGIDVCKEVPGRFIVAQPRVNGDIQAREGLMRVLVWLALFRNWGLRDLLRLAELAWKPYRIGYYDKEQFTSKDDVDALREAVTKLTTSGVAMLPKNVEMKIEYAKSNVSTGEGQHSALLSMLAGEMSKATLGQTETTEAGSGTKAVSSVHNEVRHDIRDSDAAFIASVIRQYLIAPLVRMNFGENEPIPELAFISDDPADILSISNAILNFAKAGVNIRAAEARSMAGFSEPVPGDELVGGQIMIDPNDVPVEPIDPDEDDEDDVGSEGDSSGEKPITADHGSVPLREAAAALARESGLNEAKAADVLRACGSVSKARNAIAIWHKRQSMNVSPGPQRFLVHPRAIR